MKNIICNTKHNLVQIFITVLIFSKLCAGNELSLNGIVPIVGNANGYGWTAGISVGGFISDNNVDLYAGYWDSPLVQNSNSPQIATNALIFPSAGTTILAPAPTNIIWYVSKITDDIDGTNLTITKISVHLAGNSNELAIVTNNVSNLLGEITWLVPENLIGGDTNYVLKFDVVDSSSLTNSCVFWDNKFVVVPEPLLLTVFATLIVISSFRHINWLRCH